METQRDHADMVRHLTKPPQAIRETLSDLRLNIWHAATGISTEAGELLSSVKKIVIYDQPPAMGNIIEELGDIEFYLEQLRQGLNLSREFILQRNIEKLTKRYSSGYSDKSAQIRIDKEGKEDG